jgi:hypothetical protein
MLLVGMAGIAGATPPQHKPQRADHTCDDVNPPPPGTARVEQHATGGADGGSYVTYWQPTRHIRASDVQFASLGQVTAQAVTYATTSDAAGWPDPNSSNDYWFHIAHAVDWDDLGVCNENDEQRFRSRIRCTWGSSPGTGQSVYCNMRWVESQLRAKPCSATVSCASSAPWGTRNFSYDHYTDKLVVGGWHRAFPWAVLAYTEQAWVEFLGPHHTTRFYTHCSRWLDTFERGLTAAAGCNQMTPL